MKKPQVLTVHDIAKLAGVSAMTVSRAFNSPERLAPATLSRVQEVVRQTNFVPNAIAGSLRSSRARLVAAIVPTLVGPVFQATVRSLSRELGERGYQLMIGESQYETAKEDALLEALIGRRPDGIAIAGIMHSDAGRRQLITAGIPVVETWDFTSTPIDMLVGFSHERIGESVCAYLHDRGYRSPAIVMASDPRAQRRAEGFQRRADSLGMGRIPLIVSDAPGTLAAGRSGMAELNDHHPQVDSVFCSSDMLALGTMIEAQTRGIAIPDRLAVVGFADNDMAAHLQPALTSVRIDGTRIGRTAAQLIIDRTEGRPPSEKIIDVGFEIIERAST